MRVLILATPAILIVGFAWWHWNQLSLEHGALVAAQRTAITAAASPHEDSAVETPAPGNPPAKPSETEVQFAALLREIQAQETAIAKISQQADELAARLPVADSDELIASFGRIEDMGRNTGAALQGLMRMLAGEAASGPEDEANFLRLMRVKGQLPEIRAFENNPDEIARFQSSTLRQALGLADSAEEAMRPLIRDAFTEMARQNLTAAHKPSNTAEAEDWIARRSQALQGLMRQLRPHLPESDAESTRQALMFALNVGAGLDEKTSVVPGVATLTLGVTWPKVPW